MSTGLDARIVLGRGGFALDIELVIPWGTTAALLGPNGAGKSTVVEALVGSSPLDAGRIELDGRVLDDPAEHLWVPPNQRRLGVVFQRYYLFEHLDVLDNVAFGPRAEGRSRRAARALAHEWLERLGLAPLHGRRPSELSGGEAQRVALARALITDPSAVLLDEPMAALDVEVRAELRRLLAEHLARVSGPRLLITHDPADAFLLADRIHIVEGGRITQHGTPDELRARPVTPYAAALAGVNLLTGTSRGGLIELDDHDASLQSADTRTTGTVFVIIHPNAVALHAEEPHGSPRNSWSTRVRAVEPLGDVVRVMLDDPLPLSVDITPGARTALALGPGSPVWASVKATEIAVNPA